MRTMGIQKKMTTKIGEVKRVSVKTTNEHSCDNKKCHF